MDAEGRRRRTVQMPRQVALITTRVELPKDDQLLSRFLVVEVRESPDKRKSVLTALAATFNGVPLDIPREDALEPVRAFAEWLGRYKVHVAIPYAHALAELFAELPANERDFRDFATLLKLVAACALWNLTKRQHTIASDTLRVTADLSDYETVYRLLLPVWGKPRSAGLSETERRVAEALRQAGSPATAEELAKITGITDRSVRRALNALAEKSIAERGEKRGRSYEWRLVADLDVLTVTLPTPEAVAGAWQPDPTSDQPTIGSQMDAFTDITDIHGHKPMSAKNSINTSTFGFTDKRTREVIYTAHSITLHDHDKSSGNFSPVADADSLKNRVRDVRDAKNPSPTSIFHGHDPMSANVRDVREEVKVTCPCCGASRRVTPDAYMLADPRCPNCGEIMQPAPEGDEPTDPSPEPAQSESSERLIDTEEWIDQWWREVMGDQVTVDLETGEPTPVGNLAPPTRKEARCSRCGHRESVDPEVLLPPLCPVCDAPMEWDTASTDDRHNPLVDAIERIADLSSQLGGGRR